MQKIYLIGDIHGSFKPIRNFYQRHMQLHRDINNGIDNVLICLGDFGGNFFFNHRDIEFKKKLGTYNLTYFVIRGNHEERPSLCAAKDEDAWTQEVYFGNCVWVEKAFPYIKYAMDYPALYEINGYKTLVIPGAYSVDKYVRLAKGWSWFAHEQLSQEEMNSGIELLDYINWNVDIVLSHTCPICYEPTDLFLSFVDQSMVEKDMERYLGQIEYQLDYSVHLWGHYHQYREYPREIGVPCSKNPRQLMLFNDYVVELQDVMTNKNLVNRL